MKIFSWNCQGIGKPPTKDYLRFCLTQYDPDIFFILETKAQNNNMKLYLSHTHYPHFWFAPSIGLSGGIALTWKTGVDLELMHTTSDTIHAIIYIHDNMPDILLICMYGAHNIDDINA